MASVSFKTTDGIERTIGWSYFFGYDSSRVTRAISEIDSLLEKIEKNRKSLMSLASAGTADSIRDHQLNYVYVGEYEEALIVKAKRLESAMSDLKTARANLKLLYDKRQVVAGEIASNPLFGGADLS